MTWKIPFAVVRLLVITLIAAFSSFSQTQNKVLDWGKPPFGSNNEKLTGGIVQRQIDDVEIESIAVAGQSIILGQPFSADDNWLKELSFRVKNLSGQKLALIQITLALSEMGNKSPQVGFCYGCKPAGQEIVIEPGEEVELTILGGKFYEWVLSRAAESGITRISKAQISEMWVKFPDGKTLLSGCIKTADPKNACPVSTSQTSGP